MNATITATPAQDAAHFIATHGDPSLIDGGGWVDLADPAFLVEAKRLFKVARRHLRDTVRGAERRHLLDSLDEAACTLGVLVPAAVPRR